MRSKAISDIDQAKHDIVHAGKFAPTELAELANISYGTMCNKVSVTSPNHHLTVDEALKIQKIQDNRFLIEAECRDLGGVYVHIPPCIANTSDSELIESWAAWHKDTGETAASINKALQARSITRDHLAEIRREMFEDFQRELELLHRLEALCDEQ